MAASVEEEASAEDNERQVVYEHLLKRTINSKTARAMLTWSHYRFRQHHLLHKAREFPWCRVVLVSEAYTSKTCSECGNIKRNLGSNKVYKCKLCSPDVKVDRDWNAARGILVRFLTEWGYQ